MCPWEPASWSTGPPIGGVATEGAYGSFWHTPTIMLISVPEKGFEGEIVVVSEEPRINGGI